MLRKVLTGGIVLAATGLFTVGVTSAAQSSPQSEHTGYIVTFHTSVADPAATADGLSRQHGGAVTSVYQHALRGYAASLPASAVARLRSDPRVASVEPDQIASITAQTVPTGIQRIFADDNPALDIDGTDDKRIDADIAILDTGVDHDHPDLNVVGRTNCAYGFVGCNDNDTPSALDDNHGQWHSCYLDGYKTTDPDGGFATTFTYKWDFGDGTTGIIHFHRFPAAGTYTVKLTVTDDEQTSATVTKSVTVP